MTFTAMQQWLYDHMGATGETALVTACINRGKDRFIAARKWFFLEASSTLVFPDSTRSALLNANVDHIVNIEDASGNIVEQIDRRAYDELYRPDVSTGSAPKVFTLQGTETTGALRLHWWPSPALNTGTVHFHKRVADLASNATVAFDHIPSSAHFSVLDFAEAELFMARKQEERAAMALQKAEMGVAKLAGELPKPQLEDKT